MLCDTQTHRQIQQCICSCIIFTHLYVRTHACIKASAHDFPYVRAGLTGHTAHAHTLFIHTHADPKAPNPNKQLASWRPTESLFQFFFLSFCYSGIVTMPTACHLRCCLKVTVTCSHCADIIHKQTYNKGCLPFIVCLSA